MSIAQAFMNATDVVVKIATILLKKLANWQQQS